VELDQDTHEVWRNGELVRLSATEFQLLRYLMTNAGRVLSARRSRPGVELRLPGRFQHRRDLRLLTCDAKLDDQDNPLIHTVRGVATAAGVHRGGRPMTRMLHWLASALTAVPAAGRGARGDRGGLLTADVVVPSAQQLPAQRTDTQVADALSTYVHRSSRTARSDGQSNDDLCAITVSIRRPGAAPVRAPPTVADPAAEQPPVHPRRSTPRRRSAGATNSGHGRHRCLRAAT